jgi:hypothetical protein
MFRALKRLFIWLGVVAEKATETHILGTVIILGFVVGDFL